MNEGRESLFSTRGGTPLGPHFEAVRQSIDVHPNGHPCHLSLNVIQKHCREVYDEQRALDSTSGATTLALAEQTQRRHDVLYKALADLVEHIDLNGGCHRGCPEHDAAKAALDA